MKKCILLMAVFSISLGVIAQKGKVTNDLSFIKQGEVINTASLLRNLYDLNRLALLPHGVCKQFSSYDRFETNADVGNFLSIDDNRTAILADMKGPGAIVRIWSANPQGTLKIYLDDQPTPVIDCPFATFFEDPQYSPIRIKVCGGRTSYWPIPYSKSCKVVVEKPSNYFYWQITYQTYPGNTKVETYTRELTEQTKAEQEKALQAWRNPSGFVPEKSRLLGDSKKTDKVILSIQIPTGKNMPVFFASGPGCVDYLLIRTKASIADLKKVVLRAYWDGDENPGIESPLPDFFGSGYGNTDFTSLPMVMKRGDFYLCRFPMPFARSASIQIENGSANPLTMQVEIEHRQLKSLTSDALYFHARWRKEMTRSMTPFTILAATGQGRFVGCNMTMHGGDRGASYLEGDEMLYVDGEKKPSLHGTGTEDYFNCGWYFQGGPAQMPLYGATEQSCDGGFCHTTAYRFHIPDDVPFSHEFAMRIEHGLDLLGYDFVYPDKPGTDKWSYPGTPYACTAYYYQKEPHAAASAIVSAAVLDYFDSPGPPAREAFEAEDRNPRVSGGSLEMKKWDDFAEGIHGTVVPMLIPDGSENAMHFSVPVTYADCYEIFGFMVQGQDYGKFTCSVGDQVLGEHDLFADCKPRPSGSIRLGVAMLKPGENQIIFKIRDKNADGKWPKIGVDRLMLQSNSKWIPTWQIIGPFDNKGADIAIGPDENPKNEFGFFGIDDVFPPEKDGFIPGKTYHGKAAEVAWKPAQAEENGHVDLARKLGLAGESNTGYLYTRIDSPGEMDTELNVAPSDALKVWVNNDEIFRCELVRNQDPGYGCWIPIHLRKGENTLLLKVTHSLASFWGCYARVRDPGDKLQYNAASLNSKTNQSQR